MEGQVAIASFFRRFAQVQLATAPQALKWKGGATLRGLESLPLKVSM
jgi:cytochrome P450